MTYSFDIDVAKEYGVNEAIMIQNFKFWIMKNKATKKNFFDGHYWTYCSKKALMELFGFWSEQSIKTILNHLKEKGVLITANYNNSPYDRTLWYAFADEKKWLGENALFEKLESTNEKCENNQPIPDINTDIKTDNKEKLLKKKDESAPKEGQECPAPSGDPTPPTPTQKFSFKDFVAWWNEKFIRCSDNTKDNIVRIRVITHKRESVFKARWADTKRYLTNAKGKPTDAEIFAYMTNEVIGGNYVNSDWMQGKVTNGTYTTPYRVEYDNILAPGFWTKLLEKKYYNRELDKVKFND